MSTKTRLLLSLFITGLFLSLTTPAMAARSYLIELVIFTTQDAGDSENWTSSYPSLNERKMSRATKPGQGGLEITEPIKELEESTFSYYVKLIRKNPKRKVVLSTHWVQPVLGPAETAIARITDAQLTDNMTTDSDQNAAITSLSNAYPGSQTLPELPLLDGFINFYLNSQYTLEADIRYTPPYRPSILDEEPDIGPVSYRIYEKRPMKSGELNYYDHPEFGMVLLVTPVETASEVVTETN